MVTGAADSVCSLSVTGGTGGNTQLNKAFISGNDASTPNGLLQVSGGSHTAGANDGVVEGVVPVSRDFDALH